MGWGNTQWTVMHDPGECRITQSWWSQMYDGVEYCLRRVCNQT